MNPRTTLLPLCLALSLLAAPNAAAASAGSLSSSLHRHRAQGRVLAASVRSLSRLISRLDAQVKLISGREAQIASELAGDRASLATVQLDVARQRRLISASTHHLQLARSALGRQLRSGYESDPPDVVSVVLDSHGFGDLLDRLDSLRLVEQRQQQAIAKATSAKALADAAASRLGLLEQRDRTTTAEAAVRAGAIASISRLLAARQAVLHSARAARLLALRSNNAQSRRLVHALAKLQATAFVSGGGAGGPWAIPTAIVMCESGGQNLPPNSAGASGYYQFLPSTWTGLGGSTPAAYLAGRAEQDRLAAKLWDGGRGASNWVCAGIVATHG